MNRRQWRGEYAAIVAAYAQRPSDDLIRRAAQLGDALAESRVSPQDFVAAHTACLEQLCATHAGGDDAALTGATEPLLEVMKAYGRRLQQLQRTPRQAAEPADHLSPTLDEAKRVRRAVPEGNRALRRRLERHTADLAAANKQLQQAVAERKRAEQILRESEDRLHLLTDALPVLISYVDAGQRYRFNNRGYEEWFGVSRAEINGRHIRDVLGGQAYQAIRPYVEAALSGQEVTFEKQVPYRGGGTRYVSATYVPHISSDGQVKGFYALILDITERKQAEELLRESEQRYRALFEQAADAILLIDGDTGGLVEFNDRAHERLGYTREEFRKLKIADIEVTESPEEIARHIAAIYKSGAETFETKHRTKTGEIRDILVNCKVIPVGQKLLFQAIWSDITERRRAEQEARQRQAELAHVSRLTLMGEMASSLSHDISQPLSTILFYARGCVRRIRSGAADPAALLDVMEKVAMQAEAAGRIVRRLREFVSKRAPHLSTVDVNDVVRRSLSLVQSEISEGRITVRFQAAEPLPPVRADRIQIEQVILNLIRNSAEALQDVEAGRRELTIATSSSAGNTITVAVRDTGPGLSAEVAGRVFDSFFTTKPDGMGMGLSISRSIIEAHGGRLWAVPNAERGATFQFSLPVMKGTADEEA